MLRIATTVACVLLFSAAVFVASFAEHVPEDLTLGGAPAGTPPSPADEEPAPLVGVPEPKPSTTADVSTAQPSLLLPTGESVPGLNGVTSSVRLLWPTTLAYSPITGTRVDPEGLSWYLHADGSQSTTQMVYRSDLGRETAMSIVANPTQVLDVESGSDKDSGRGDEKSK